ncbi:GNAT family N-acetyltransferase [Aliamphritea spongicola]|uniref:GNAT family N-acetyltransferase n=1 Tax=Aliamphritea spongicola TaxID=707589 RepID=UPI00196AB202|nr:N-acetyltransferase [Aliamphritea spongicola]MBN3562889.1 N-acetyltransferase [Aliamphritea spongicola]
MNIHIRNEQAADAIVIESVTRQAFENAAYSSHTEQFIIRDLRNAGQLTVSLVAEWQGAVIGHAAVSPVTISDGTSGWYGLGPLSVLPEYQGKGIGSSLMREAVAALKAMNASGCVLLGEPEYYGRFGFVADSQLVLEGVPPEYFLALQFSDDSLQGKVTYHSAFSAQA